MGETLNDPNPEDKKKGKKRLKIELVNTGGETLGLIVDDKGKAIPQRDNKVEPWEINPN